MDVEEQSLLGPVFAPLAEGGDASGFRVYVDLPLHVYAALRGDTEPPLPLAVATTLVYAGANLLDDLADREAPAGTNAAEHRLQLLGNLLLHVAPRLTLQCLNGGPQRQQALQESLTQGLIEMTRGQMADLRLRGSTDPDPERVEACAAAKAGGEHALFARLAAMLADEPAAVVGVCDEMGRATGTAAQIASDCVDIVRTHPSADLSNGTRSLPIALHLRGLDGAGRTPFLRLLAAARHDTNAQEAVRAEVLRSGAIRLCGVIAGLHVRRAERCLVDIARHEAPAQELREWMGHFAFARAAA